MIHLILAIVVAVQISRSFSASSLPKFVLSPATGQSIPARLIDRFKRAKFSSNVVHIDNHDLLFEVISNDRLIGPAVNVSLAEVTSPINANILISYESNGKRRDGPPADVYMTYGGGYSVVYEEESEHVLSIWGNGIYLKPLDAAKFPGVFINVHNALELQDRAVVKPLELSRYESAQRMNTAPAQTGSCASGTAHRVELAIAYDNTFCKLHSNSEVIASAYVQAAVNEANFVFMRDSCVSLSLVHIESHCEDPQDPYSALAALNPGSRITPSSQILEGFKAIWGQSREQVRRDVAYFFSGFEDGTNVAGLAFVAACCNSFGYGWVEKGDASILVHELGHSIAATHSSEGVMKAIPDQLDSMFFSDSSVAQITEFIDNHGTSGVPSSSRDATCIEVSQAKCDDACPSKCVAGQCIATYSNSVPSGIVPCSPVKLIFRCTQTISSGFTLGDDCPTGFDFVLREGQDLDVFCCASPLETISKEMVTAEYPFVDLKLTNPDGSQQIYPEYIQDTSLITNLTLMRSQLIPSCGLPSWDVSPPPTPSRSPLASLTPIPLASVPAIPIPPSLAPIPFPTLYPRPFPLPSARFESQTPLPGFSPIVSQRLPPHIQPPRPSFATPYTSCGEVFDLGQTFKCMSKSLVKTRSSIRNATIKLRLTQKFGLFSLEIKVGRRIKIHDVAALITTDQDADESSLNPPTSFGANGTTSANFSTDAFAMKVPDGKRICCGEDLFSYAAMTVCSSRNPSRCTATGLLRGGVEMKCKRPCQRKTNGSVLPSSATIECPKCIG